MKELLSGDAPTRRTLIATFGTGALAILATALPGQAHAMLTSASLQDIADADILTFALNLEYLEAEFYSVATTGEPWQIETQRALRTGAGPDGESSAVSK